MNPNSMAAAVTDITERLANLLSSENDILVRRKPRELAETLKEKQMLTDDYERRMREIKRDPKMLERLERSDMDRLRAATAKFQDALEDHRRLIQATKSVTERMVKAITDEVAANNRPARSYDAKALMTERFVGHQSNAVTLAVDQAV